MQQNKFCHAEKENLKNCVNWAIKKENKYEKKAEVLRNRKANIESVKLFNRIVIAWQKSTEKKIERECVCVCNAWH